MKLTRNLFKLAAAAMPLATVQAATINLTNYNPNNSNLWNNSAIWGNNAVEAGNDYQAIADPTRVSANNPYETNFTVAVGDYSKTWAYFGQVRDTNGGSPANTTFNGDRLILTSGTRLLSKGRNTTTTANLVMQDNSYLVLAPDGTGTTSFAGTISITGSTAIAIHTNNNGQQTLNVDAPITGSGTLSLVLTGNNNSFLNLNGDISGFTGTLLVSSSTTNTTGGSIRTFSIAESATLATLWLNWESNAFRYDLADNDVTFASLILGADTALAPDTYDADALNALTGNAGIFSGTGTITVIPEPGAAALAAVAALAGFGRRRRRTL